METAIASLTHLPASATPSEVVEVLRRDGGVIIDNLVTAERIDRVLAEMEPYTNVEIGSGGDELGGGRTRRLAGLLAKSSSSADLMMNPLLLAAAQEVLEQKSSRWIGDNYVEFTTSIQLSDTTMISILPGETAQMIHRDDMPHHRTHPGPDSQVLAFFAAVPFTFENGATQVIPGSHLWDDQRQPHPEEAATAAMDKGSVVFYLGSTYHGGGANITENEVRTGLVFVYTLGHLRQLENQYIAVPIEKVRAFPTAVQKILGWSLSDPYCGLVELDDPQAYLAGNSSPGGFASEAIERFS